MTRAEVLVLVAEDWLRRLARDGCPLPGEHVRVVLAGVALAAPGAAARCPELLAAVGPRVALEVNAQAAALAASETAAAVSGGARWITTAQAARLLGLAPDSVRWLLRRGALQGRRVEQGWQVAACAVTAYAERRRYGERNGDSATALGSGAGRSADPG